MRKLAINVACGCRKARAECTSAIGRSTTDPNDIGGDERLQRVSRRALSDTVSREGRSATPAIPQGRSATPKGRSAPKRR